VSGSKNRTQTKRIEDFICVACGAYLESVGDSLVCKCGEKYPIADGIPIVLPPGWLLRKKSINLADFERVKRTYDEIHEAVFLSGGRDEYKFCASLLSGLSGKRVLDIGCGIGALFQELANASRIYGLDISLKALKIAKKKFPFSLLIVGMGEFIPFPSDFFDIIFCLGSLEHFLSIEKGLSEMSRILKHDGKGVILLPKKQYWLRSWLFNYVLSSFRPHFMVDQVLRRLVRFGSLCIQPKDRYFSRVEATDLLETSGFKIERFLEYPPNVAPFLAYDYVFLVSSRR